VHYNNIHAPRVYDRREAPFQPAERGNPSPTNEKYKNYYKDVVHLSDLAVGKLLRAIRQTDSGSRTVVVYTSDHGESYHEHNPGDHAGTVFDEEIRVPGWIDAPPGTLSEAEEAAMRGKRDAFVWHVDVLPTVLDLMGLWDAPALAAQRARMMGHPLTRPDLTTDPVPLSNVSWSWEYRYPNWGAMQGNLKVVARHTDSAFHCFDVVADPLERAELPAARCSSLLAAANAFFPVAPARFGRLRDQRAWGDP
jgi:arylsulfatase A-like enzyme